jgi:type II secretory pathway pseudopilin PulG
MTKKIMVIAKKYQGKFSWEGLTIIELLVSVVMGGVVLTAAASGFINLLQANQDIESKTIRHSGLIKALNYLQEDIKTAQSVTIEPATVGGNCDASAIDSKDCLKLIYPNNTELREGCVNNPTIYYGLQDISGNTPQIWLKPAILRRKIICDKNQGNWIVVADGLLGKNEPNPVIDTKENPFCQQDSINWTGSLKVYGAMTGEKGGFRFCLHDDTDTQNRLVRIFLYGHIINRKPIKVSTIVFTRN